MTTPPALSLLPPDDHFSSMESFGDVDDGDAGRFFLVPSRPAGKVN